VTRRAPPGSAGTSTNGRVRPQDPFVGVPVTLNIKNHPDFRSVYLLTYVALRSFVTMAPASDGYCRCYPSVDLVAAMFGLDRSTVFRSINWLEDNAYLYRQRRNHTSSLYTIVIHREPYLTTMRHAGAAAAQHEYEQWLAEVQADARRAVAAGARLGARSSGRDPQPSRVDAMPLGRNFTGSAQARPCSKVAPERLQGVAGERSRSGATLIKIQQLGRPISKEHQDSGSKPPELSRFQKETTTQLPPPIRAMVNQVAKRVPAGQMTEKQRQSRLRELERQRTQLLAEAAGAGVPK